MTSIQGIVIKGDAYGRTIGFPTANIDNSDYLNQGLDLKRGIYAGFVKLNDDASYYLSGIVVGPDYDDGQPKLEAHLIGYSGDLYDKKITFYLSEYLRAFESYESEEVLRQAISDDIKKIKTLNLCLPE